VTIGSGASTTVLTSDANPVFLGKTTVLTATVTGTSTPQGLVTFKDGASVLGTSSMTAGTASLSLALSGTGTHALTATYLGDGSNASSSGSLSQEVSPLTTTTTVLSSRESILSNAEQYADRDRDRREPQRYRRVHRWQRHTEIVRLTAVTATTATATYAASWPTTGTHTLTALYSGDTGNKTSTSAALTQTVKIGTSTSNTTLTSSANPSYVGSSVTLTITVGGSSPVGTVNVLDGTTVLGTTSLNASGVATLTIQLAGRLPLLVRAISR
jgi:hypothetical protein